MLFDKQEIARLNLTSNYHYRFIVSSLDGVGTTVSDLEETYDCGPCHSKGCRREAMYCCSPSCQECLCAQCKDEHKNVKMSSDHQFSTASSLKGIRTVTECDFDCD